MSTTDSQIHTRIRELACRKNAVILAHNYQRGEIQDVAHHVGDSLGLSRLAADTDADIIVFCGVYFMAETAKLLSPDKKVLIPDPQAGCPMANMITGRELEEAKREHPDAIVVCYVNSTAEVKAHSDVCVTSGNALDVCRELPRDKPVLFVPDAHLGRWVAERIGRDDFILWEGFCPTHQRILPEEIRRLKREHPEAEVLVHPECPKEAVDEATLVTSTSGILKRARESDATEFIIGTECGILHRLAKENPGKTFYRAGLFSDCPNMKLVTLEKLLWSLEDEVYEVEVEPKVAAKARKALESMVGAPSVRGGSAPAGPPGGVG